MDSPQEPVQRPSCNFDNINVTLSEQSFPPSFQEKVIWGREAFFAFSGTSVTGPLGPTQERTLHKLSFSFHLSGVCHPRHDRSIGREVLPLGTSLSECADQKETSHSCYFSEVQLEFPEFPLAFLFGATCSLYQLSSAHQSIPFLSCHLITSYSPPAHLISNITP